MFGGSVMPDPMEMYKQEKIRADKAEKDRDKYRNAVEGDTKILEAHLVLIKKIRALLERWEPCMSAHGTEHADELRAVLDEV